MITNERGFSLIELIIYTAIVSVVVTTILLFSVNILNSSSKAFAIQEVQHNIRFAGNRMKYDIQTAEILLLEDSVFDDDNGRLSFEKDGQQYVYEVVEGEFIRKNADGSEVNSVSTSSVEVTMLRFENRSSQNGKTLVKAVMDLRFKNPTNQPEFNVSDSLETILIMKRT